MSVIHCGSMLSRYPRTMGVMASISIATVLLGVVAPIPAHGAAFQRSGRDCVTFDRLPAGWKRVGSLTDSRAVVLDGFVGRMPFRAIVWSEDASGEPGDSGALGHDRLPDRDFAGFRAWRGDDGEIVFADGDTATWRTLLECAPPDARPSYDVLVRGPPRPACTATSRRRIADRTLQLRFAWDERKQVRHLMHAAADAIIHLSRTCP